MLNDDTLFRLTRLYQLQAEDLALYEEQLARWTRADPTADEAREIDQLQGALGEARRLGSEILTLVEELKEGTIDHILRMGDVEPALEVLSGTTFSPSGQTTVALQDRAAHEVEGRLKRDQEGEQEPHRQSGSPCRRQRAAVDPPAADTHERLCGKVEQSVRVEVQAELGPATPQDVAARDEVG